MTNVTRRVTLAGLAALPVFSTSGFAQTSYPEQPVRLIVGFSAGGVGDIMARLIGEQLEKKLGQQIIVENRPGAAGNIATEAVIRSPADGYTLFLINTSNAVNASLYDNLNFNFIGDMVPAATIARAPSVMVVNPAVPVKTVAELIAYAKANPGKVNIASGGNGTMAHMAGELFMMRAGVKLTHVAYRGGAPALADVASGHVHMIIEALPPCIALIQAGKLRPLAVTPATRSPALPDVPTIGETVPGFEASGWFGLGAPKNTPGPIVEKLNATVQSIVADPLLQSRLADLGAAPLSLSPSGFAKLIAEDTEKWAEVVRFSKVN